jgi:hypothetical protein
MHQRNRARAPSNPPDERPKSSPDTDPTNPFHQEAVGEWVAAEHASERKIDEPGLTREEVGRRDASR